MIQKQLLASCDIENATNFQTNCFQYCSRTTRRLPPTQTRDAPDAIRERDAIFQFLKDNKAANERKF